MPVFDTKIIVVGALFLLLIVVKLLAGGGPADRPVRRPRRFGYKGTMSPLRREKEREAEGRPPLRVVEPVDPPSDPPTDPEKEFFGE
jgi:hypothetical protein